MLEHKKIAYKLCITLIAYVNNIDKAKLFFEIPT